MRITFCELPDRLDAASPEVWDKLQDKETDLLVLNEMPFGEWLAASNAYDAGRAAKSVKAHSRGIDRLLAQEGPPVLSSRPISSPTKLANEAFLLRDRTYTALHHKHYFPEEPGYFEKTWFEPARAGFEVVTMGPLCIGVLLCTEVMFTEWARHYRRQGANLIVVPRTSGASMHAWHTAAAMAALVSGAYVVSSNRSGGSFGGGGFLFSPKGELVARTTGGRPIVTAEIDLDAVTAAQRAYPCYVEELP